MKHNYDSLSNMEETFNSFFEKAVAEQVAKALADREQQKPCPRFYTVEEAAEILRVSRVTIYNLFKRGKLSPLKVGRRTLVDANSFDSAVESQQIFRYQH